MSCSKHTKKHTTAKCPDCRKNGLQEGVPMPAPIRTLPDELCKLRDKLVYGDTDLVTWRDKIDAISFFDAGAEAMRAYMQAEVDKLEIAAEILSKYAFNNPWQIEDYEKEEVKKAETLLASYRAWRDKT